MNIIKTKKGTVLVIRPTLRQIAAKLRGSTKVSRALRGRLRRTFVNEYPAQIELNNPLNVQRRFRMSLLNYVKSITSPVRPNKHA